MQAGQRARRVGAASTSRRRRAPRRPRARRASRASGGTSAAPPFAGFDDANERLDEIVLRRDLVDVDPCAEGCVPQLRLALLAGAAEPPPGLRAAARSAPGGGGR